MVELSNCHRRFCHEKKKQTFRINQSKKEYVSFAFFAMRLINSLIFAPILDN